jgi:hypothetical protein
VAADLGLVADAAERHPDELAVQRPCDRLADRGLPRPGRPDQRQDRARALVLLDAALLPELADGDVLDDAVLDVVEAVVVGIEHLPRVDRIEPLHRALAPGHGEEPVEVGADDGRLGALLADALEPRELALGLLAHRLGHRRVRELLAVLVDDGRVVVAELLADGLELAAEDVLALLLLRAGLDVLTDAAPDLKLGEPLVLEPDGELEPLADIGRLEQVDLLLEGQVGRVSRGVGEGSRLGDRAHEARDGAVVAAQLEDLLDDGAILRLQLARLRRRKLLVGMLLDLDAEVAARVGVRCADDAAEQPFERHGAHATGQADAVAHLGDSADLGVFVLVARHEQDALVVADVHGEGDVHVREDDGVLERHEQERAHGLPPFGICIHAASIQNEPSIDAPHNGANTRDCPWCTARAAMSTVPKA